MFCPEGYLTLYDAAHHVSTYAYESIENGELDFDSLVLKSSPRKAIKEKLIKISEESGLGGNISLECSRYVLNKYLGKIKSNCFVCLTNGSILSISSSVFSSVYCDALQFEIGDFGIEEIIARQFSYAWDFPFVDNSNYCIDSRSKDEREKEYKLLDFDARDSSCAYRYWDEHLEAIQRAISPLNGLPICIKKPENELGERFIIDLLAFNSDDGENIIHDARKRGRPRLVHLIKDAICELYPNGRYPSLKELAREICRSRPGIDISDRTVRRALDEIRGQKSD